MLYLRIVATEGVDNITQKLLSSRSTSGARDVDGYDPTAKVDHPWIIVILLRAAFIGEILAYNDLHGGFWRLL